MPSSHAEPRSVPASVHDDTFTFLSLWRILSVRRAVVLRSTLAGATLAVLLSLAMGTKFAATAILECNTNNAARLDLPETASGADDIGSAVSLSTEARTLQSDELALNVIRHLNLEATEKDRAFFHFGAPADDFLPLEKSPVRSGRSLRKFHDNLTVQVIGGTRLIEVRYVDRDPALAANVVNSLLDAYRNRHFQSRYTATLEASDWLSQQLAQLKTDVEASEQRLADFQRATGLLGESETNNIVVAKLEDLNRQLSAAEANRIVKEAVWRLAKSGDPELISSMAATSLVPGIANTGATPSLLPTLRAQEAQLKADIAQTASRLGPAFPKLVQMRAQLSDLQDSIQAELAKTSARAENDYLAAKTTEAMERARFERQKQEANKLNDGAVHYGILKREADANRDLYQGLIGKLKEASVLAGLHSSDIVVIDPARIPDKPSSPKYPLNLALGTLLGLLSGIIVALISDSTDRTIRSPEEISRIARMPTLSVLPLRTDANSVEISERVRTLRGAVLADTSRVFVISSPLDGEGKSTLAIEFARSLAKVGQRTLLVDADLHRPSLHRYLGFAATLPGLNDLLGSSNQPNLARPVSDHLDVVLAGPSRDGSYDRLNSVAMAALTQHWRTHYDNVVLDTPPILACNDAVFLSKHADRLLLVLRADHTTADALLRTIEICEQSKVEIAGAILNGLNFRSPYYKHYYGHAYRSLQERNS